MAFVQNNKTPPEEIKLCFEYFFTVSIFINTHKYRTKTNSNCGCWVLGGMWAIGNNVLEFVAFSASILHCRFQGLSSTSFVFQTENYITVIYDRNDLSQRMEQPHTKNYDEI